MHKNRILGVAVAAAFSLPVGMTQAGSFENLAAGPAAADGGSAVVSAETTIPMPVSADGGVLYALELFGDSPPTRLPDDTTADDDWAAAKYVVDGDILVNFNVVLTLDGAVFANDAHPRLGVTTAATGEPTVTFDGGGKNQNTVTFTVDTSAADSQMANGDDFTFLYRLGTATNLATKDGVVKLSMSLKDTDGVNVNSPGQITVATAKESTTFTGKTETDGTVKVSVGEESKRFTGNGTGANISSVTARIGLFTIKNAATAPEGSNGDTDFITGMAATDGEIEKATIVITNGQFAASQSGAGRVYVCHLTTNAAIGSAVAATDDTTATIELTNTEVGKIVNTEHGICMDVDTNSEINPPGENPPSATLKLEYKQTYVKDLETTFELREIKKDGTVCRVLLIPSTDAPREKMNIRVTNNSAVNGKILARLYKEDGSEVPPAGGIEFDTDPNDTVDKTPLGAGKTFFLNAAKLEEAGFEHWAADTRPQLVMTTTLPDVEVLAMMRHVESRYIFNMSSDASGSACER
jgi:hypothetical protein